MIVLVDYGIGNLRSVQKALEAAGAQVTLSANPDEVRIANKIVLPGVGAFGDGMRGLCQSGLADAVCDASRRGTPLLGICLGMQALFESSEELGQHDGLGLLPGRVLRLDAPGLKVPHTGWNQVTPTRPSPLLHGLPPNAYAYFNHAYYCAAQPADTLATTEYSRPYPSVVARDNIYGIQFHPEKSQQVGLGILRNFVERV